ncbi:hypothetical protein ACF3DV_03325 [Chlorogloeopsis fritschii PCC 9212]
MLQVQELAVDYRGVLGLDRVSFRVEPGQLVGIIGQMAQVKARY